MADKQVKAPTPEEKTHAGASAVIDAIRLHNYKPEGPELLSIHLKDGGVDLGPIGQRSIITSIRAPNTIARNSYSQGFEATVRMWLDKPLGGAYLEWVEKGQVNWAVVPFSNLKQYKPDLA